MKIKNLNVRLSSSLFLFVILFFLIFSNKALFLVLLHSLLFLTLWEYIRLIRYKFNATKLNISGNFFLSRQKINSYDYMIIFLIVCLNIFFFTYGYSFHEYFLAIIFIVLFCLFLISFSLLEILGLIYFSAPFFFLMHYKVNYDFSYFVLFVVFFSIFTDSGAYIFGNLFGGKKPFKSISPNKTISGFFGGIICPIIFCHFFYYDSLLYLDYIKLILFSFLVQFGDLIESYFKRICFVKESSNLIPGHGGILDRLDGVFFLISMVSILNVLGFNFFFIR